MPALWAYILKIWTVKKMHTPFYLCGIKFKLIVPAWANELKKKRGWFNPTGHNTWLSSEKFECFCTMRDYWLFDQEHLKISIRSWLSKLNVNIWYRFKWPIPWRPCDRSCRKLFRKIWSVSGVLIHLERVESEIGWSRWGPK